MHSAYEVVKEKNVVDLNSKGYLLRHKKTGAKIFILSNDDENKVFYIGFRTPPYDSTGLPHILEHSVLCGSKKYPVKDPFVELCKGSLNTFLNAMTYPDKTVYPIASCNDQDFKNLMDVYMDAVFHPNIYEHEEIFRQEGFRYELENKDDDITINGVVYNEMKGAFSTPDDIMNREIFNTLFPDTAYGVESGGDPDVIPELTYEKFLEFHSKYYHPSNSYIYLYGNMDVEERLDYLDKEYLSKYDAIDIDSEIGFQKPFAETKVINKKYSVTSDEPIENNTYLSYNVVVDSVLNKELYLAFQVIDYCLIGAPGAVLTERLLKSGLVSDVDAIYENGILQPYYSIMGKGANASDLDEFIFNIKDELQNVINSGIDKDMLRAAINVFEFKYREADFGRYPKGLMYGLQSFDSWLYDDNDPFMHIEANDTYALLRSRVDTDYFEKLIEKYLLNNTHSSIVVLEPEKGYNTKKEQALKKKLSDYKASLSDDELDKLINDTKSLKKYQEEPSSKEDLEKIPLLKISDIKREAKKYKYKENEINGTKVITHDIYTNGIGYVTLYFDLSNVPVSYYPYVGLLTNILSFMNTKNYSYTEFTNKVNIKTGGISTATAVVTDYIDYKKYTPYVKVRTKVLYDNMEHAFDLMRELIVNTDYSDDERLLELLNMIKARMQPSILSAGHSTAFKRALSYISKHDACKEKLGGLDFYRVISGLIDDYDNKKDDLKEKLNSITAALFRKENLTVDYIGDEKYNDTVIKLTDDFAANLITTDIELPKETLELKKLNEGLKTSGQVQYVARVGNFRESGLEPTGALMVLKVIMGYDYLWNNVRVKGGAYGCMSGFSQDGIGYFVSYRDPNLKETIDIFEKAADYIENFNCSERDMTKFIIGTMADIDSPLTPYDEGIASLGAYLSHKSDKDKQKNRDDVLNCNIDRIRELADYIREIMKADAICVVGAEDKINANKDLFLNIEDLL